MKSFTARIVAELKHHSRNYVFTIQATGTKRLQFNLMYCGIEVRPQKTSGDDVNDDKVERQIIPPEKMLQFLLLLKGQLNSLTLTSPHGDLTALYQQKKSAVCLRLQQFSGSGTVVASIKYQLNKEMVDNLLDFFTRKLGADLMQASVLEERVLLSPPLPANPSFGLEYSRT